ncbi:MAG: sulfur oxidation c-type cytochrome SoxX [Burkholderiales bacterium]
MKIKLLLLLATLAAWVVGCATFPDADTTAKFAEQMVREAHTITGPDLNRRTVQDASQQMCSAVGGPKLSREQAAAIVKAARDSIQYPASGKLTGDWKVGAQLIADGRGQRIVNGKVEALKENGALCINCHAMDPTEVNAGNVGPALVAYGTQRGNSEAVARYTYERIFNAWAFMPCSNMPRLGSSGFLTPDQIAHVVAYLIDPQSPVNKK